MSFNVCTSLKTKQKKYVFLKTLEQFVSRKDFETSEKKQERLQADIAQNSLQITTLKDTLKTHSTLQEANEKKLKETNEIVYKLDNVQIPSINTRLGQMTTKEDLTALKRENEEKVK